MLKFPESFDRRPACFVGVAAGIWGVLRPLFGLSWSKIARPDLYERGQSGDVNIRRLLITRSWLWVPRATHFYKQRYGSEQGKLTFVSVKRHFFKL